MKQFDLLIGKKAERNDFLEGRTVHLLIIVKAQSNHRLRGGLAPKTRASLLRNSSLAVRAEGTERESVAGLESCFSFCPDFFTQKHPSGAAVIMEHKIA